MGKEIEDQKTNSINGQQSQGPKIVKLHYKIDKLKSLTRNNVMAKSTPVSAATQSVPKTNFMIGDKVLSLSKPQYAAPIQEITPEMLKKKSDDETAWEISQHQNDDSINTVSRDQLMNLNEAELKYLKNVVINKFKDENLDKLNRSKRRYGW